MMLPEVESNSSRDVKLDGLEAWRDSFRKSLQLQMNDSLKPLDDLIGHLRRQVD